MIVKIVTSLEKKFVADALFRQQISEGYKNLSWKGEEVILEAPQGRKVTSFLVEIRDGHECHLLGAGFMIKKEDTRLTPERVLEKICPKEGETEAYLASDVSKKKEGRIHCLLCGVDLEHSSKIHGWYGRDQDEFLHPYLNGYAEILPSV